MRAPALRSPLHRSFPWLLWLVMVLPLANSVATWHGYTHLVPSASIHDADPQAPDGNHCDICLAATAASGGAWLAAPPTVPFGPARHALACTATVAVWLAMPALAYLSRAPPSAPR